MARGIAALTGVVALCVVGCGPPPTNPADGDGTEVGRRPNEPSRLSASAPMKEEGQEKALQLVMPSDVAVLIVQTSSPDAVIRAKAARDLGRLGEHATAAVPSWIRLLNDIEPPSSRRETCPSVRASEALRQIGKPSIPLLLDALKDEDPLRRESAASLLGDIGAAVAVEALVALLGDAEEDVHRSSINSLRSLADARAIGPLTRYRGRA